MLLAALYVGAKCQFSEPAFCAPYDQLNKAQVRFAKAPAASILKRASW